MILPVGALAVPVAVVDEPQRAQLEILGLVRSQLAQARASSLEAGFFFIGMALGGFLSFLSPLRSSR